MPAAPATAHETQATGPVRLTLGWSEEPAYTGARNAVEVLVADSNGTPIDDIGGTLSVEVSFGDEVVTLALAPSGRPGTFTASLVPTRPGTFTFHVMGRVRDQPIDTTSTCSEQTFDCVLDVSTVQFPATAVADDQLAERLDRQSRRVQRARDAAAEARLLAIGAVVVALATLVVAVALGRRRGPRSD